MPKPQGRDERGRVKFRVVEFELEGSDASLQDALRNLATALTGGAAGNRNAVRVIDAGRKPAALAAGSGPAVDADAEPDDEPADEVQNGEPTRRTKAPGKPRVSPTPEPIDIDLTSGDVPLKDFLAKHAPGDADTKRYLAIAQWLKAHRGTSPIGVNHMYTCYRHMGWNLPADALKPFHNVKRKGWFVSGEGTAEFAINHLGEGVVNSMGS